ncbi:hypothetical protein K438DRAFT_1772554 [Mycena galopus ATCC 62051]|nr:hypothetical protein K438DRAFT_1772554 [Mycena galopus ATCC 62051]
MTLSMLSETPLFKSVCWSSQALISGEWMSLEPLQEFQYTDYLAAMRELNVRGYPHSDSENSTLNLRAALGLNLTSAEQEGVANHRPTYSTGHAMAWLYLHYPGHYSTFAVLQITSNFSSHLPDMRAAKVFRTLSDTFFISPVLIFIDHNFTKTHIDLLALVETARHADSALTHMEHGAITDSALTHMEHGAIDLFRALLASGSSSEAIAHPTLNAFRKTMSPVADLNRTIFSAQLKGCPNSQFYQNYLPAAPTPPTYYVPTSTVAVQKCKISAPLASAFSAGFPHLKQQHDDNNQAMVLFYDVNPSSFIYTTAWGQGAATSSSSGTVSGAANELPLQILPFFSKLTTAPVQPAPAGLQLPGAMSISQPDMCHPLPLPVTEQPSSDDVEMVSPSPDIVDTVSPSPDSPMEADPLPNPETAGKAESANSSQGSKQKGKRRCTIEKDLDSSATEQ